MDKKICISDLVYNCSLSLNCAPFPWIEENVKPFILCGITTRNLGLVKSFSMEGAEEMTTLLEHGENAREPVKYHHYHYHHYHQHQDMFQVNLSGPQSGPVEL